WEAGQRLMIQCVLAVLEGAPPAARCAPLVTVVARVLDDPQLDAAFREQMLMLPSEGFVAEQLPIVDPAAIRQARDAVRNALALGLATRWGELYASLSGAGAWSPDPRAVGARALRNAALGFWIDSGDAAAIEAGQ